MRKPDHKLTRKQQLFVAAYIRNRGNATAAARDAGYAHPNKAGFALTSKEYIQQHINYEFARAGMTAERVLYELSLIAQRGYANYIQDDGSIDLAAMKRDGMTHLIKKIYTEKDGGEVVKQRVEFYDGMTALTWAGKHHGLFVDRVESHETAAVAPMSLDEWRDKRSERHAEAMSAVAAATEGSADGS